MEDRIAEHWHQPLTAETENDRLDRELADTQADLQRHRATLAKLQGELMASRLEVSGARGETDHYKIFLRQAEAHIEELRAHAANQEAEIVRLDSYVNTLHSSLSWRISAPVRMAGRVLWRSRRFLSGRSASSRSLA